jgi:transposase
MLKLSEKTTIYVASHAVDCRKAINGLAALVSEELDRQPHDGSVYVFYNQAYSLVKCLFWDKNGFVLYHKRLERGRFKMSRRTYTISQNQLGWLLAGLDFQLMNEFSTLDFTHYF